MKKKSQFKKCLIKLSTDFKTFMRNPLTCVPELSSVGKRRWRVHFSLSPAPGSGDNTARFRWSTSRLCGSGLCFHKAEWWMPHTAEQEKPRVKKQEVHLGLVSVALTRRGDDAKGFWKDTENV